MRPLRSLCSRFDCLLGLCTLSFCESQSTCLSTQNSHTLRCSCARFLQQSSTLCNYNLHSLRAQIRCVFSLCYFCWCVHHLIHVMHSLCARCHCVPSLCNLLLCFLYCTCVRSTWFLLRTVCAPNATVCPACATLPSSSLSNKSRLCLQHLTHSVK
jgi:hypothetical protein